MYLEKRLNLWEKQNLISSVQKKQILEFEKSNKKPLFLIGMTLLGIFTIALGVISIVAANWFTISGTIKIISDIVLLSAVAFGTFQAWEKDKKIWFESGLVALFMLSGASIALIGQVFQTNGSLTGWGIMWSIITLPLLVVSSKKVLPFLWSVIFLSSIGSIETLCKFIEILLEWWFWDKYPETGLICLLVIGGILAGFFSMLDYIIRPKFQIFKIAVFYAYLLIYGTAAAFMIFGCEENNRIFYNIYTILTLFFTGMAFIGDRLERPRQVNGNIAALYIVFLFIYFRVIGNLITTGVGLIVSGAVIIGGMHLTHKIIKKIKNGKIKEKKHAKN